MKAFNEISGYDFFEIRNRKIEKQIDGLTKEYILGVDENEYKEYIYHAYYLEPLKIIQETELIDEPQKIKQRVKNMYGREDYDIDAYKFTIKYTFTGDESIFKIRASRWTMVSNEIQIFGNHVSFNFTMTSQNPDDFYRIKKEAYHNSFCNIENANSDVIKWNNNLKEYISKVFNNRKKQLQQENNFFAAIKLNINKESESYTVPTIKKKVIPQPSNSNKEFSSEPTIAQSIYDDILRTIYTIGKNFEKKPSLYYKKDEEALRDLFLTFLEQRYDGVTATSETFNRGGKTDILLKYDKDGSNLFVAECKLWKGIEEFFKAIYQLFDRYLTWRDSKTALIFFVQNKEFSKVLNTIKTNISNHEYYIAESGMRGETSLSYKFRLSQDPLKEVQLEVILFHFDK